jgi:hypothetical protein
VSRRAEGSNGGESPGGCRPKCTGRMKVSLACTSVIVGIERHLRGINDLSAYAKVEPNRFHPLNTLFDRFSARIVAILRGKPGAMDVVGGRRECEGNRGFC